MRAFKTTEHTWLLALAGAGAMVMVWMQVIGAALPDKEHLAESECRRCHLTTDDKVEPSRAGILLGRQEELCADCHPNAVKLSHPSGFMPSQPLPKETPRDWKGELTCSTCHLVHGTGRGLLRTVERGATFCLKCHDDQFFETMADQGNSMMVSGHLDARSKKGPKEPLDAFSMHCLSCHEDRGTTQELQVRVSEDGVLRHNSSAINHPIGGSYDKAAAVGGYHPRQMTPKEIVLPEGRISCVSCHEGYSKVHGQLVLPKEGSQLCFSCHDL